MLDKSIYCLLNFIILAICLSSCTPEPDLQKIKNVTVRIDGRVNGSGVIVKKKKNNYSVLVTKHTIATLPGKIDSPYLIVTVDGKSHQIKNSKAAKDIDLAIIEFQSKENYSVAEQSSQSLVEGTTIFLSGWKGCVSSPTYEITKGKLIAKKDEDLSKNDRNDGYEIKYTNPTATGMSGSPIFDKSTKLIGIHGMPGREKGSSNYNLSKCELLENSNAVTNGNFGITMKTFNKIFRTAIN